MQNELRMNIMNNSVLETDIGQILRNAETVARTLPAETRLIPVLKCDAYGLGAGRIARALEELDAVESFAVAHVSEGLRLREFGIDKDILVMSSALPWQLEMAAMARLTLTCGHAGFAKALNAVAEKLGTSQKLQIKIDTGLHRIGFLPEELEALCAELREAPQLRVTGTFSHFSNTEDAALCAREYAAYQRSLDTLRTQGIAPGVRHMACSAASERYPQYGLDAVRVGRRGVTAIIGSGGKTTLMLTLARELSAAARVIVTTTTHIYPPSGMRCLMQPSAAEIAEALAEHPCVAVGSPAREGKLAAAEIPMAVLAELADYVLVEADGAHGFAAKAHADYEPVVPPEANQTILVFGLSALGQPIADCVHRAELFAARYRTPKGTLLTPQLAAECLNGDTPHTRVLLNQADTPERAALAREMCGYLAAPTCIAALQGEGLIC